MSTSRGKSRRASDKAYRKRAKLVARAVAELVEEGEIQIDGKQRRKLYLWSQEWIDLSKRVRQRDDYTCVLCGRVGDMMRLEVHHLTYDRLYKEKPEDLVTLCRDCHHAIHYDESGKRRRDWRKWNPKPVLPAN